MLAVAPDDERDWALPTLVLRTLPEQVRLAYQLIERARAQPVGERSIRRALLKEIIH